MLNNIKRLNHFSITLLTNERLTALASPEVKTGQIMKTGNVFHEEGLFSTEIFGEVGTPQRMRQNGHINLKLRILHPLAWLGLTTMSSLHRRILSSETTAVFDKESGDFVESEDGRTGFNFYMETMDKIKFTNPNNSDLRAFKIRLTSELNKPEMLTSSRLAVLSAGYRDYVIDKNNKPSQDEVNDLYRTLINTASLIPDNVNDTGDLGIYLESLRIKMQITSLQIYLHSLNIIDGKRGIIRGNLMNKAVDFGTRNVITADNSKITKLGEGTHLRFNDIAVGLFQHSKAINPITIGGLTKLFGNIFSASQKTARIIDIVSKQTSTLDINNKIVTLYTTEKGINKYTNKFKSTSFAKAIFGAGDYCFAMIRDIDNVVELVYDTTGMSDDELEPLRPATNLEILYFSIVDKFNSFYASTTRYPAINQGGTYPVKPSIKPTLTMVEKRVVKDGLDYSVFNYPVMTSDVYDSMSPHHSKLGPANADFDGDQMNYAVYWSTDANEEIKKVLDSRAFYIGIDNKLVYTSDNHILRYVVGSIHKLKDK